jgi:Rrf2 family protein
MISTRGRYSLRVIVDLAEHAGRDYIPLAEVAARQEISVKYMEGILPGLVTHGFLEGLRGKGGGYRLARPADSITVLSVLSVVEESLAPVACLRKRPNSCHRAASCRTLPMWEKLYETINGFLAGITIADLCHPEKDGNDFVI